MVHARNIVLETVGTRKTTFKVSEHLVFPSHLLQRHSSDTNTFYLESIISYFKIAEINTNV